MAKSGDSTQPRLLSFSLGALPFPSPCHLLPFSLYPFLLLLLVRPVQLPRGQHSLACASVSSPPAEALNAPDNSRKVGPSLPTPPQNTRPLGPSAELSDHRAGTFWLVHLMEVSLLLLVGLGEGSQICWVWWCWGSPWGWSQ